MDTYFHTNRSRLFLLVVYVYIAVRSQDVTSRALFIIDNDTITIQLNISSTLVVNQTKKRLAFKKKKRISCSSLLAVKNQTVNLTRLATTRTPAGVN